MDNIIRAVFCGSRYTTTKSAWLIDHGMVLKLSGVELPEVYEVDFSNSKTSAAKRVLGNADGVVIPDEYFLSKAQQIYAWVYLTTGDSGFTTLQVTIPLTQRPDVTDEPPTPQETDLIEQAIAALNTGVTRAETAADDAEQSAAEAKEAAENIQQAVEDALQEAKESGEFDGKDGANGVTYTPTVDAEGVISWVNDGDLPNPQPRDIRGPQGEKLTYNDLTPADKADLVQGPIAEAQTAAVAAVNQAGAAQAEAVQQKGAEVLESIPADYTELAEDVSDLKSAIKQTETESIKLESGTFQDPNGVVKTANNARVRNIEILPIKRIRTIKALSGYSFWIFFLDSDVNLISATGWVSSVNSAVFPANTVYINFAIRKNDAPYEDISDELATIENSLIIEYQIGMIAPVLKNYIADTDLAINDFRIVNNVLYRIVSPVSNGGTLTPYTNCIPTTVANILKTLLS